jgi:2-dehydropantoate 2-reductase
MKVCVVGAGAVGGLFLAGLGGRWPGAVAQASAAPRVELSALARGDTLKALQTQGLRVIGTTGESAHVALRAADRAAELGAQDLVIVAVKGPALPAVAAAIGQLSEDGGTVLVAMNGVPWWFAEHLPGPAQGLQLSTVDPGARVAAHIPSSRVLGCVVHVSASQPAPGSVRHHNGNSLILGEPAGGSSARLDTVATLLTAAGFAITKSERIQRDIWFKLWGNMTMNPISALTGATCDRILDDPLARVFCSAVMLEAQAIGAAIGLPIEQDPDQRHAVTRKLGAFKTSMLQDVEAGRALELDALVGAVRELGQRVGIATPNVDALMGLTRLMAQSRGLYPLA